MVIIIAKVSLFLQMKILLVVKKWLFVIIISLLASFFHRQGVERAVLSAILHIFALFISLMTNN